MVCRSAFLAVLMLGIATAQDRRPAFVTVTGADGKTASGVQVRCFASPWFGEIDGTIDVVEGRTDERGRAIVKLLPGRGYSVFAVTAAGTDGTFAASDVAEDLWTNGDTALQLGSVRLPQRLTLRGAEAWQTVGPLSLQVSPRAHNVLPVPMTEGRLPPLPSIGSVRVLDGRGDVLWSTEQQPFAGGVGGGDLEVTLPPPRPLGVRVVDSAGAPKPGVEIWQGLVRFSFLHSVVEEVPGKSWRRLGVTGADGVAPVQVAAAVGGGKVMTDVLLQVRGDGLTLGTAGVLAFGNAFSGHAGIATPPDQVLPVTVQQRQPLCITPTAEYDVLLVGMAAGPVLPAEGPVALRTDREGKAMLPLPEDKDAMRVVRVVRSGAEPVWAVVTQADHRSEVALSPRAIRVRLRDAEGNPPRGARLVLVPWNQHKRDPGFDLPMTLDAAGCASIHVSDGDWFLWATQGESAAWRLLHHDEGDGDMTLVLAPVPQATVHLTDPQGKSLAGWIAQCTLSLDWNANNASVEDSFLVRRQIALLPRPVPRHHVGGDGCLRFPLLPLPGAKLGILGNAAPSERDRFIPFRCTLAPGDTSEQVLK